MSETTPKLGLYQLIALQGDAYVLYNESLFRTELFAAGVVKSRTVGTPPDPIVDGDAYIVPSGATGGWANRANHLQLGLNNAWLDIVPFNRCGFWVEDEDISLRYLSPDWSEESTGGNGGLPSDVPRLNTVNVFNRAQGSSPVALTPGASVAVDAALSNTFTLALDSNSTVENPINLQSGFVYNFHVSQAASGGPYTLDWGSAFKGSIDALTTTANQTDWYAFQCIGGDLRFAGKVGPF